MPLKEKYPELFEICTNTDASVAEVAESRWHFPMRRWPTVVLQIQIRELQIELGSVILSDEDDKPRWRWTKSGQFTVKSVYKQLSNSGVDRSFKHPWKARIPPKIKVWLWLIWHNAIATKR